MLHSFIFPQEPLCSDEQGPSSPIESSLSSFSDEPERLASNPFRFEKNSRELAHKNWEEIEQSIIHWFEGKQIRRGEPAALQEDFCGVQRRAIRLTDQQMRVSQPSRLAARKLTGRIHISV